MEILIHCILIPFIHFEEFVQNTSIYSILVLLFVNLKFKSRILLFKKSRVF